MGGLALSLEASTSLCGVLGQDLGFLSPGMHGRCHLTLSAWPPLPPLMEAHVIDKQSLSTQAHSIQLQPFPCCAEPSAARPLQTYVYWRQLITGWGLHSDP